MKTIPSLATYSLLGRSGLRVSPLALGTMTFGTEWGWGAPRETAFAMLDRYLEAGGNLLDTANGYTNGTSERLIGEYFAARGGRDRAVIATKFTFSLDPGDPNGGGNGRKNIHRALEGSLERLRTDYVDLYWLHAWDGLTPVDEVMGTLYSLVERNIEREHVPAALALGLGITPWSPLASGLLSGKYTRDGLQAKGAGRLPSVAASGHPAFEKLVNERNWTIVDTLVRVAKEIGAPPAQVALS